MTLEEAVEERDKQWLEVKKQLWLFAEKAKARVEMLEVRLEILGVKPTTNGNNTADRGSP